MFDLTDKRAMNKGFGDGMSRAFEFAATPLVFGGLGYLVDQLAGTTPGFTVGLAVFGVVGMFLRLWYGYDAEMREYETGARWSSAAGAPSAETDADDDLWAQRRTHSEGGRRMTALAADANDESEAPEAEIVRDLLRRALPFVPVPVLLAGLVAGIDGAVSALVGVALVAANFAAAAGSVAWAARINLGLLMGVALFGYLLRISVLFGIVFLLRDLPWVHLPSLGITLVVTHLGLLVWETRYVAASLAHPALKPSAHKEPNR